MTDLEDKNLIELVGGPQCGLMYELNETCDSDVFDVPYQITDKKGKVHSFEAHYAKRMDGKAQYCGG